MDGFVVARMDVMFKMRLAPWLEVKDWLPPQAHAETEEHEETAGGDERR